MAKEHVAALGGKARAKALSKSARAEIAREAARAMGVTREEHALCGVRR